MTARLPYLTAEKLENHRYVRTHNVAGAQATIMHGSGQPQITAGCLHRHRQVAQAPVDVGCRIIKAGAGTAEADAACGLALHLENADFARSARNHWVIARFNFGYLQRKPRWHASARCFSFYQRNHIVARRLANLREMGVAMAVMFGMEVFSMMKMVTVADLGFSTASHGCNANRSRGQQKCKVYTHAYIPFIISDKYSNNQGPKAFGTYPLDRRCLGRGPINWPNVAAIRC